MLIIIQAKEVHFIVLAGLNLSPAIGMTIEDLEMRTLEQHQENKLKTTAKQ